jgi:hypothetical protein
MVRPWWTAPHERREDRAASWRDTPARASGCGPATRSARAIAAASFAAAR